ncbi:hypothetical protein SDC9_187769 [bioreactor metagenome]|uniref:Uncharacterized protein n=1 Tax=bioreactor metagenome TaxID=1076179 RepID=A0A645HY47_9ZZZZ
MEVVSQLHSLFLGGGDVGIGRQTLGAGHGQELEVARVEVRLHRPDRIENDVQMTAQQAGDTFSGTTGVDDVESSLMLSGQNH